MVQERQEELELRGQLVALGLPERQVALAPQALLGRQGHLLLGQPERLLQELVVPFHHEHEELLPKHQRHSHRRIGRELRIRHRRNHHIRRGDRGVGDDDLPLPNP